MFTRILGSAILGMVVVAAFWSGHYLGVQSLPAPAPSAEQVRAEAIMNCFRNMTLRYNRNQPDPEVLASINEQCRRLYDER
jgi:hypothetical protein